MNESSVTSTGVTFLRTCNAVGFRFHLSAAFFIIVGRCTKHCWTSHKVLLSIAYQTWQAQEEVAVYTEELNIAQ